MKSKINIVKEINDQAKEIVKSIKYIETYQEDKGQYNSSFYYRIDKKLKLAYDDDAFCKIEINHKNSINYENFHNNVIKYDLAIDILQIDKQKIKENIEKIFEIMEYIYPITKEEYEKEIK